MADYKSMIENGKIIFYGPDGKNASFKTKIFAKDIEHYLKQINDLYNQWHRVKHIIIGKKIKR